MSCEYSGCVSRCKESDTKCNVFRAYQQGRADTIEEFRKWYVDLINNPPTLIVQYTLVLRKLEQMKGE